jgi:putative sigma-54 modulation protein
LNGNGVSADEDLDDEVGDGPRIAKRKRFATKPMDPEEAALQMALLGHAFFLFTNTENGRAALLYRRNDGDLGLIETTA